MAAWSRLVATVEQRVALYEWGFDFIGYSGDVWVLRDAVADGITRLCAACAPKKGRSKR